MKTGPRADQFLAARARSSAIGNTAKADGKTDASWKTTLLLFSQPGV